MISRYGNPDASVHLIRMADSHDFRDIENEAGEIARLAGADFLLTAVGVEDWNRDLSPWKAPAVFGREGFGDGAAATLQAVLEQAAEAGKTCIIGGYSLAGLFALWAAYQTDVFSAVAAASPSVWFPGFTEYMAEHEIRVRSVYLSLGDREEKARNPVLAAVGGRIRQAHEMLKARGINTVLEWNPGNHFTDAGIRTARAFAWAIRQQEKA